MKNTRFHLILLACFGLSVLTTNAAQLASAKVLSVTGTATLYSETGEESPVVMGEILKQGDSVTTTALSEIFLVFSNGSEITVMENSSVTLAELSQEAFSGDKSYEQLKADPSKSQALLELNYGKVSGHVKQLRPGSEFSVETPLGTAAIRGTQFDVELRYNAERGEFIFITHNKDGRVQVVSRYAGDFEYGRGTVGHKGYEHKSSQSEPHELPQKHTTVIRLSENNPHFDDVINPEINYPPYTNANTRPSAITKDPTIVTDPTAEDVQEVSPSGI